MTSLGVRGALDLIGLAKPTDATSVQQRIEHVGARDRTTFFLKAYRLPTWARQKRMWGRGTAWGIAPEVREFRALVWLREQKLPAVEPVAAASWTVGRRLRAHALLVRWEEGAVDLAHAASDGAHPMATDPTFARRVAAALGTVVGRMHALGFHHRDLFPRNVLLAPGPAADPPHLLLLDCRRGGVGGWRRRRRYDLQTILADGTIRREDFMAAYRTVPGIP